MTRQQHLKHRHKRKTYTANMLPLCSELTPLLNFLKVVFYGMFSSSKAKNDRKLDEILMEDRSYLKVAPIWLDRPVKPTILWEQTDANMNTNKNTNTNSNTNTFESCSNLA